MSEKVMWRPGTMVYPVPAVLVSCGNSEKSNLFTVAWTGTICSDPAMLYISVRPERASYELIKEQMEFTVNLTTRQLCRATDWCGVRSGRDYDKWREMGLTAAPGVKVACPHVAESPMSIECRVKSIVPLGTHHMFIAEVLSVLADEQYLDPTTGAFDMERAGLIAYAHGGYYTLGETLGKFGFSVQKKNNKH
jgi:flavin reductase (DIM6/NTAB) family NADH-FMN oxidoreductase RutF